MNVKKLTKCYPQNGNVDCIRIVQNRNIVLLHKHYQLFDL